MEGNNRAVELRSRSHLIQYEGVTRNYAPLFLSLQLYRERGLLAARQLRKLAEQLHLVTKESMEQRRTGCKVRGLGSVIATGAGVAGRVYKLKQHFISTFSSLFVYYTLSVNNYLYMK